MAVTMADITKLRKMTGAGMMDCKNALNDAEGDFDKAMKIIREKGQAVAAKRSDREASEGCVLAKTTGDFAVVIALKCETDFVAQNADFVKLTQDILDLAVANTSVADIEITSIHAQKGIGLMDYAKTKGYQADEIVAIGDSGNDYSMLSLPGIHSVAMANATEEIQNVCVYRTRDNANDGIAYIIRCILADRNNFELR